MQNLIFNLILLVIGVATGLFIQKLISRSRLPLLENKLKEEQRQENEAKLSELNNQLRDKELEAEGMKKDIEHLNRKKKESELLQEQTNLLIKENAILKTRETENRKHFEEKLTLLADTRDALKKDFELLANRIFDDKSSKFKESNQENISHLLNPMKTQLEEFRKRVDQVYDSENKDRASLRSELLNLRTLNETLNKEAKNLTNALKRDPKKQGNWGEMKLERVLEDSGLDKNIEYFTQAHYTDVENNSRYPDVVIKLPEERDIIIDAKTSLTAYERFTSSETDSDKESALKAHLASVKKHVGDLAGKAYQNLEGINTVSHVLMFIPIESAYLLALENDNQIFVEAIDKNIMIVGPSTLIYVLRMIKQIWRSEYQTRNVLEIAEEGGKMYDKLCGFIVDLEKIDKNISDLKSNYDASMNKLSTGRGNLIRRAEIMKDLGAKAKKQLTIRSEEENKNKDDEESNDDKLKIGEE